MLPSLISIQPALPLTDSGKVDRRALPDPTIRGDGADGSFVAPRTELETQLASIWTQLLGLPKVGVRDDFFSIGGHSLAALKLITRLAEAGHHVEVVDLFRNPTIESLARVLKPPEERTEPIHSDAYVVRIREGAPGRPPLVLLPSDFGDLLIYSNLLRHLDPGQPCIGLQCPRMYENDEGIASMPGLASFFVKHLLNIQPRGPYLLAGYCFGGLVALEMAKLLKAGGHRVAMLGLIDSRPYHPVVERHEFIRMLVKGAMRARPADWKRHLSAKLAMRREDLLITMMARSNPDQLSRRDLNRWVLEQRVLRDYRSGEYDDAITFFYPEESRYELYGDPTCGWLYMAERVLIHKVTGSHLNMMKEPHVKGLADKLHISMATALGLVR